MRWGKQPETFPMTGKVEVDETYVGGQGNDKANRKNTREKKRNHGCRKRTGVGGGPVGMEK